MGNYASQTTVSPDRSRAEIERTLRRYGANKFQYGWDDDEARALIAFEAHERTIRFTLQMPSKDDPEFTQTPTGKERSADAAFKAWEQATRQRWRALALVIKAKLEAVESGITTFEEEFLSWTVLPNRQTVGEFYLPQVQTALDDDAMPPLLTWDG